MRSAPQNDLRLPAHDRLPSLRLTGLLLWASLGVAVLLASDAWSWGLLMLLLLSPIIEEIVFRDLLWTALSRWWSTRVVCIVVAAGFALAHAPEASRLTLIGAASLLSGYFVAGCAFGLVRHRAGVLAAIAWHGVLNAVFILLVLAGHWAWTIA